MELLEKICDVARKAGEIMRGATGIADTQTQKSGDYNPVTAYDVAVQKFVFGALREILPDAKFIGEEEGTDSPTPLEHGYSFIVDPIDGTTNFIHAYRPSCVSIGLLKDGKPYIGVIYDPYMEELFYAEAGKGAYCNGAPIHASEAPLEQNLLSFGTSPYYRHLPYYFDGTFDTLQKLFPHCQDLRRSGSAALDMCYVAAGRAGLFFELVLSPYDYAAGAAIVAEAGGIATQMDGSPLDFAKGVSVLAGGKATHPQFFALTK